ncbi:MAG: hypothetical protein ACRELY_20015 [Polyangiaceae bacterium]
MPLGGLASDGIAISWLDTDGTSGQLLTWNDDAGVTTLASMSVPTPLLGYPTSSIAIAGGTTSWIEGDTASKQSILRELTSSDGGARDAVPLATATTTDGSNVFAIVPTASGFEVRSFSLDGTTFAPLEVSTASGPALGAAVDASNVYFTSTNRGEVWRVSRTGNDSELLAGAQDRPVGLAVDDAAIYWANEGSSNDSGSVMKALK